MAVAWATECGVAGDCHGQTYSRTEFWGEKRRHLLILLFLILLLLFLLLLLHFLVARVDAILSFDRCSGGALFREFRFLSPFPGSSCFLSASFRLFLAPLAFFLLPFVRSS